jgi:hypothetical protein
MAVAIVFLMVIVAAVAVLFGCLRGFSRAAKPEKVHGLLVRASGKQEEQTRLLEIPISATSKRPHNLRGWPHFQEHSRCGSACNRVAIEERRFCISDTVAACS